MTPSPLGVIVATLGGLAIGLERQWSGHASGPRARFAGIRTLALLGGLAGTAGWLWAAHAEALAVVLLLGAAAVVVTAYVAASHTDIDATTETSALVVLAAGVLAGMGQLVLSSAIIAVTTFFLVEKSHLHALVRKLDDEELRAGARFAVMAAVVLPLLPAGPFPPWATVRPRETWLLVLFFSGLSFGGYIARRLVGPRRGYSIAGLLGGLISSTNVTLTFARTSRATPALGDALGIGSVAACTLLFVRVGVATLVIHPPLALVLARYLVPPLLVGAVMIALQQRRADRHSEPVSHPRNPLELAAALQMAVLFQLVLIGVELARRTWGDAGVVLSGAVLGLTDVDALTFSMAQAAGSGLSLDTAARGIVTGLTANTVLKLVLALVLGGAAFRRVVGVSLTGMALVLAATLLL